MSLWYNGTTGLYTVEIKNFGNGVDLFSCGDGLYALLDNAKLYTADDKQQFVEEAYEPEQIAAIKDEWAKYHKRANA